MWEAPNPGDIVWCHFPDQARDVPGEKPRPALVITVKEYPEGVDVVVAYGTSQKLNRLYAGEFAIRKDENKAAFETAGLSHDTKFNLDNKYELPWNDTFFSVPQNPTHGQTPKLGCLHIGMMRALEAAVKTIKR